MTKVSKKQRAHLEKVTRMIPGYDAWATAVDCHFDYELAQKACDFFPECLKHVKGEWAGRPIILEEWQQGVIANTFGWQRPDGTRRYRTVLFYVPRKNAKTTIAAGIALYLEFCDNEPGAEIYSAAADEEQAGICHAVAKGMIEGCPSLAKRAKIYKDAIAYEATGSTYLVLTSKAATKHGLNPHGNIIDELHAQKDNNLVDTLVTGVGSRRQPLTLYLTTADFAKPSICNETHRYANQVREGIITDPYFLPVIYEAKREDDWKSEATWRKANPNLGISVKMDYFRAMCKKAQNQPSFENTFKRLHLNIVTEQADRWLQLDKWDLCIGDVDSHELAELLAGEECYGGLDLSSKLDLTAFGLVFKPTPARPRWAMIVKCWAPKNNAQSREDRDRVPYLTWGRQGFIKLTDGDVIDYDVIRADINALGEIYNIKSIGIDPWGATQITTQLGGDGFDMVPFRQGYASLSAPTKELEKIIVGAQAEHGGNPVLRWAASNVSVERDAAGNVKPSKKHSAEKIDPILALIMGIGLASSLPIEKESKYEERDLVVIGSDDEDPQEEQE